MSNLVRVFLAKSSTGYIIIPCDAAPEKFSGNTIVLTFDITEEDRCLIENSVVSRIVNQIAEGIEKLFYKKPCELIQENTNCSYGNFVSKGRKYFRKVFFDRNNEKQRLLIRRIMNEGWKAGKNTIDIAADFHMNYKTLNGILVEWGIRSNKEFYSEEKILRKRLRKYKN